MMLPKYAVLMLIIGYGYLHLLIRILTDIGMQIQDETMVSVLVQDFSEEIPRARFADRRQIS